MRPTPGPWSLAPWDREREYMGADFGSQSIVGADGISPGVVWGSIREAQANARLIAAAPELLVALKMMVSAQSLTRPVSGWVNHAAILMEARAAIAKAEGIS